MTKVIDRDEAIALLERAVNEKGADYVYPDKINCLYADGNRPGCIVGHALSYVGVSVDQLARLDHAETYLFPVDAMTSNQLQILSVHLAHGLSGMQAMQLVRLR